MRVLDAIAVAATVVSLVGAGTPTPTPTPSGSAAPQRTVVVSTSDELVDALDDAAPGDTIALLDGTYTGRFRAAADGTAAAPITLTGARAAVLTTGSYASGVALRITGSHWVVDGVSVTKAGTGIVLEGSEHSTIRDVDVGNVGGTGVHFRDGSSDGVLEGSDIHDTGVRRPALGDGVAIGSSQRSWKTVTGSSGRPDRSDRVTVRDNDIAATTGEGVDAKEGTTGGSIVDNRFRRAGFPGEDGAGATGADSWIDIAGNRYAVTGNTGSVSRRDAIQVHGVRSGWGKKNSVAGTTVLGGVPGFTVWVDEHAVGTTVACTGPGARAADGDAGLSNLRCSG